MSRRFPDRERGVSLIEVMIALAILSVVVLSLMGIMWQMGRHNRIAGGVGARSAAVESAASLALAVRWDSLTALVGCSADSSTGFWYTRCFEVQNLGPSLRQVRVIVSPAVATLLKPETVTVQRSRPRYRSPLNVN